MRKSHKLLAAAASLALTAAPAIAKEADADRVY
jgi:hypothetical protein